VEASITHSEIRHVLIIPAWYPNGNDKLIGTYHKQFATALNQQGIKANLLYIDRQGVRQWPKYPFMKKFETESCDGFTAYLRKMPDIAKISYDRQMQSYVRYLKCLYRRYEAIHGKPDLLHAQVAVPAGYAACKLGEMLGVPVVLTEHASYFERFFEGREGVYGRYAVTHADAVTCVSAYMCEPYRKYGVAATVLPNIVDCKAFTRPRMPHSNLPLHLVTVSALRPGKRIDDAIRALKILRDHDALPTFRYTVVGDGTEEGRFRRIAAQEQMEDVVNFVGRKSKDEIAEILSQSDILLMVSDIETFGIPAVEALAAGVPVVSTRCRGPEGFLTPACAELCDCHSVEALAEAILRMVNRLPSMKSDELRAVASQFDAPAVAEQALALYRKVMRTDASSPKEID